MKILLTNDDGIYSPGLFFLRESLKHDHDVTVVAPETEMSAVGHAITLSSPLRIRKIEKDGSFFGYAVQGTPADCVKIAVRELMETSPDFILSGINLGANVGVNILYSGTVSAATEGAFLGIPSAAISLNTRENADYGFAANFSRRIIDFMKNAGLKVGTVFNVNVPAVPEEKIAGIRFTRQGTSRYEDFFERRVDPRGNMYYWLTAERFVGDGDSDTDYEMLAQNMITITPIHYDLTCVDELNRLKALTFNL